MRSYNWLMPEEKYRTIIDHQSTFIYSCYNITKPRLKEGISKKRILITGNPIVSVVKK